MHLFFGTMFIRSRFRVSNDLFFDSFGVIVESKYNVMLMKKTVTLLSSSVLGAMKLQGDVVMMTPKALGFRKRIACKN